MSIILRDRGATLIELLAAVTIVVAVVTSITTLAPMASKAITMNRQRLVATQLAQALMQRAKKSPYDVLDPTPQAAANFPSGVGPGGGLCDCNTAKFDVLPGSSTVTINSITYSQSTCVNYTDPGSLQPYCPGNFIGYGGVLPDPGLKTVHVRVWNANNMPLSIDLSSKVARL